VIVSDYIACPLAATARPTPDGAVVTVRAADELDVICDIAIGYAELFALLQGAEVLLRADLAAVLAGAARAA
jgi:hypothetical protein